VRYIVKNTLTTEYRVTKLRGHRPLALHRPLEPTVVPSDRGSKQYRLAGGIAVDHFVTTAVRYLLTGNHRL